MEIQKIYSFFEDARVTRASELLKSTDDIFRIINLNEMQHSKMIAWCLNPKEGHGLSDSVLQDLLMVSSKECAECTGENKKFSNAWNLERIKSTSFGSMVLFTEYPWSINEKTGRFDIIGIDEVNKLCVVIENKYGAKFGNGQLDDYYKAAKSLLSKQRGADFSIIFVAMDVNYDYESYGESEKWAFINYGWLRSAAERAKMSCRNMGNDSARLIMNYCEMQTGANIDELQNIFPEIYIDHKEVIDYFCEILSKCKNGIDTLLKTSRPDWSLYCLQNEDLIRRIASSKGIKVIAALLQSKMGIKNECLELYKSYVAVASRYTKKFNDGDDWPVYMVIKYSKDEKFALRIVLNYEYADASKLKEVQNECERENNRKFKKSKEIRWMDIKESADYDDIIENAKIILAMLDDSIKKQINY